MNGNDPSAVFGRAADLHRSGDLEAAENACRAILASAPGHFDALYLLGVIAVQRRRYGEAECFFLAALETSPRSATAHSNRALALFHLGRLPEALAHLTSALAIEPGNCNALSDCANVLNKLGRPAEALALCERALVANPRHLHALKNRGVALARLGRDADALASYEAALAIDPAFLSALGNRGAVLEGLGRLEDALACYCGCLAADPLDFIALNNIGNALKQLGRAGDALEYYDRALRINPSYTKALNNRGLLLTELRRFDEALADFRKAVAAEPQYAVAHWNESLCWLIMGDYERGWEKYEWRWKNEKLNHPPRRYSQPLWLGAEDLRGKSIFLHAEQGRGDAIQFARYVPIIAARGASVTLGMFHAIAPLMEGLQGVERLLRRGEMPPATDFHCPLMSLPLAFGTTLQTIPATIPYLRAQPERVSEWREKLARGREKLVGVCWRGSLGYKKDAERSIRFAQFASLLSVPGVRFVSLQKELLEDERVPGGAAAHWVHPGADFLATAALVGALDLVISVDTVWVHWAGAIGKPFWILLPYTPHWIWLLERTDSPWYPTARLFRQSIPGDWEDVIRSVKDALARWAAPA